MGTMTALKAVVLDGNPMKSIRRDIIMRGTTEIKKYLMSRMENTDIPVSNKGVHSGQGESGIIGGTGEGVNAHDICQSKALDYSNKKTSDVSDDVWTVAQKGEITSVNLSKNAFTDIPPGMICLSEWLKELNMGMNRITVLNPDIGLYIKLTMLDLRNNQLTSLPNEMYSLFQLRELYISYNRFTSMPIVVYQLKKLENLFADTNKITQIDADGFKGLPMSHVVYEDFSVAICESFNCFIVYDTECEVKVVGQPAKRGTVKYIGLTEFQTGYWIGVQFDEPLGKNNGSVKGKRYFECPDKYGAFVRPENVEVGDYPEEDLGFSDEDEI
ncbi:Hypothetical predicted protein [Mytilus galloprovincialis]|nr:Hypothetical predicted protein [Mytilus galloprovincialis]